MGFPKYMQCYFIAGLSANWTLLDMTTSSWCLGM
jgi:hypothetical protein